MEQIPEQIDDWIRKKQLGKGSFGEVTFWENQNTSQKIAIKRIFVNDDNPKNEERWKKEVSMLTERINNEYIVKALKMDTKKFMDAFNRYNDGEIKKQQQLPILIMEYCNGGDLRNQLQQSENYCGINEADVLNVLKSLRSSISYLHEKLGITHRDIKPENIVIQKLRNNKKIYKLTDLGYAKDIAQTVLASHVGTYGYFAPELIIQQAYSRTVDYWSMGIVIFEIICGIRPFLPHLRVAISLQKILGKTDDQIAITENINREYVYHEELFYQNRINSILKNYLDDWLKLSLKLNSKIRGSAIDDDNNNNNGNHGDKNEMKSMTGAIKKTIAKVNKTKLKSAKIFTDIDKILSSKIMTVFSLSTYEFLYYEITNDMTMKELIDKIMHDINRMPPKKNKNDLNRSNENSNNDNNNNNNNNNLYIILPVEQIAEMTNTTKPIDLLLKYDENIIDDDGMLLSMKYIPMLYVTEINNKNFNKEKISDIDKKSIEIIKEYLYSKRNDFKFYNIIEFCRHSLYLAENQEILYMTYLNGYYNYGIYLNDFIVKYSINIKEKNEKIIQISALVSFVINNLHLNKMLFDKNNMMTDKFKDKIEEWQNYIDSISHNFNELLGQINPKISIRYESILRRSNEIIKNKFFDNFQQIYTDFRIIKKLKTTHKNYFPIDEIRLIYENLKQFKHHKNDNHGDNELRKYHKKICDIIMKLFRKREELLDNVNLEKIRKDLQSINIEFKKIQEITDSTFKLLNDYENKLNNFNERQLIEMHEIIRNHTKNTCQMKCTNNKNISKNISSSQENDSIVCLVNKENFNSNNNNNGNGSINKLSNPSSSSPSSSSSSLASSSNFPTSIISSDQLRERLKVKFSSSHNDNNIESIIGCNKIIRKILNELISEIEITRIREKKHA